MTGSDMNKGVYIALIVICIILIAVTVYFLIRKITKSIGRLSVRGLVLMLVLFAALIFVFYRFGFSKDRNGMSGNEAGREDPEQTDTAEVPEVPENSILLRDDKIWIDGEKTERQQLSEKLTAYLVPRINEGVRLFTIIDDYSSSGLVSEAESVFIKNGLERDRTYRVVTQE